MDLLVKHAYLVTVADKYKRAKVSREMSELDIIEDGAFTVKDGYIVDVGTTDELLSKYEETGFKEVVDVGGRAVLPGFVDPHTHAVFIGSREDEFQMRLEGKSYIEILQAGGGILRSVDAVRNASEEELFDALKKRVNIFLEWGTTTVEIKSGYGLSVKDELKQLEVANRCGKECEVDVVPTFLGAHAVPREYRGKNEEYIKLIIDEMLPEVSRKKLAVFCDVFCERGVFSIEESRLILNRAKELGFLLKLHADEIEAFGGAELAAEVGAISADHLLRISDAGIGQMAEKGVIAVLLPGTAFSLRSNYAPARKMIGAGVPVAIATDCNPGSSYTESMQMVITLSCLCMGLTPQEAITAATLNAAYAIGMGDKVGSIDAGKQADFVVLEEKSYLFIPYHYGVNAVMSTYKKGRRVFSKRREYSA